ncbi:YafY family transcriptional regulator [Clostridia bacterium OttesenSCG-928-O13]|nr:YafY family transcriptional regulator [Clostridia bacterium OttesenSCG-928-O13]
MKSDRLLKIIYICLQRERVTIGELADKLDVSRRTIFRDLETLGAAGIPVIAYPGAGGGVGIMEGFKLDKSLLTDDDFSRLVTALGGIQSIDGDKEIDVLMDKLVPAEKRGAGSGDIIIDLSSWFEGDEIDELFTDARGAIAQHKCISLEYSAKAVFTQRLVEPYKLVFKYQSWYLYAYCLLREDFRMFKLSRISRFCVTQQQFAPRKLGPLVFQLQGQMAREEQAVADDPVTVVLEYNPADQEDLMDRLGAQHFQENETGLVRFATTNLPWVTDVVMGLQDKVKVLGPPILKEEVRRRIDKMNAIYQDDG